MSGSSTMDDISSSRVDKFVSFFNDELTGKRKLINVYGSYGENPHRASFIYDDIDVVDGKLVIKINIVKAGEVIDRKMVVSDEELTDEVKQKIEENIGEKTIRDFKQYLTDDNVKFEFSY